MKCDLYSNMMTSLLLKREATNCELTVIHSLQNSQCQGQRYFVLILHAKTKSGFKSHDVVDAEVIF